MAWRLPSGRTSPFVETEIVTSAVVGCLDPKRRSIEFRKFLDQIEANAPTNLHIRLIMEPMLALATGR